MPWKCVFNSLIKKENIIQYPFMPKSNITKKMSNCQSNENNRITSQTLLVPVGTLQTLEGHQNTEYPGLLETRCSLKPTEHLICYQNSLKCVGLQVEFLQGTRLFYIKHVNLFKDTTTSNIEMETRAQNTQSLQVNLATLWGIRQLVYIQRGRSYLTNRGQFLAT